jgi:hypothetical protein
MRAWKYVASLSVLIAGSAFAAPKAPALCEQSDSSCASPAADKPADTAAKKKSNPGHYLLPYMGDDQPALLKRADEVCREPALKGLQVRALWATLESSADHYTFDNIEQLYKRLASCKKRLLLEVWLAKFNKSSVGIVPSYLESQLAQTKSGYIVRYWDPKVMDRLIALYQALGERFDREPYFEGIIFTETATSQAKDTSYNPKVFIDQLKRGLKAIDAAWPSTNVIVFDNYISNATDAQSIDFVKWLADMKMIIGGPDVLPPPRQGTMGERIYRGEIGKTDYRGRMLAAFAVQQPELGGSAGTWTPKELYDYCTKMNRCKYMFWIRNTASGGSAQKWDTGILPFIRANPSL